MNAVRLGSVVAALSGVVLVGVVLTAAMSQRTPEEPLPRWRPGEGGLASLQRWNEPHHVQWIDCTGCLGELTALQRAIDARRGYPTPSYYLDGAVADPSRWTLHTSSPIAHPTVSDRYKFEVLDRDLSLVAELTDGGTLPAIVQSLDESWSVDGGRKL